MEVGGVSKLLGYVRSVLYSDAVMARTTPRWWMVVDKRTPIGTATKVFCGVQTIILIFYGIDLMLLDLKARYFCLTVTSSVAHF